MDPAASIFVPAGHAIPLDYAASYDTEIPAIRREDVRSANTEVIDITSCEDRFRQFTPGPTTLTLHDGRTFTGGAEAIGLALNGGGKFTVANLRPVEGPITQAQHLAQIEADEEAAALEASEWY